MNEKNIEDIISALYDMVQDARALPLGADKCILERDKVLDMLDEVIAQMPVELKQARTIVESRNELIGQARREAENLIRQAQAKAAQLVAEEALYLEAVARYRHVDATMRHSYKAELAKVYQSLGTMYFAHLGRNGDSKRAFSEAIHVHYAMGSNHQVDVSLANVFCLLADVYFQEGRFSEAKEKYANALDLYRKRADNDGISRAMQGIEKSNMEMRL